MNETANSGLTRDVFGVPGLEKFIDRLQTGMELEGRIVEQLGEQIFILRVWGNNILTESSFPFKKFDEVILQVQAVQPKLVFRLLPVGSSNQKGGLYA